MAEATCSCELEIPAEEVSKAIERVAKELARVYIRHLSERKTTDFSSRKA